ncbi:MAG: hypothetical protein V4617_15015 [Gemmatimonadota bacterium]
MIYGVNHLARRSIRDVIRESRKEIRDRKVPCDPWLDACAAGRSGNHCADFLVRFAHVLHVAGDCPKRVRAKLIDLAARIADATHVRAQRSHTSA